jgi:hypothetical protein
VSFAKLPGPTEEQLIAVRDRVERPQDNLGLRETRE